MCVVVVVVSSAIRQHRQVCSVGSSPEHGSAGPSVANAQHTLLVQVISLPRAPHAAPPRMPPKRVSAKAKARAKLRAKNAKRDARRSAIKELNVLASERAASPARLDAKTASGQQVARLIRRLESRCQDPRLQQRLRAAAEKFQANGGKLEAEVLPEAELETAPAVAKHRVLKPGFKLKTKAFMLTFNSRNITPAHWPRFPSLHRAPERQAWCPRLGCKLGAESPCS